MIFDFKAYRLFKLSYIIAPHFQNELSFTDSYDSLIRTEHLRRVLEVSI